MTAFSERSLTASSTQKTNRLSAQSASRWFNSTLLLWGLRKIAAVYLTLWLDVLQNPFLQCRLVVVVVVVLFLFISPLLVFFSLCWCFFCAQASQEQCCVCKQKIVGDCVENNGTYYHPECMKVIPSLKPSKTLVIGTYEVSKWQKSKLQCHVCDEPLRHSYHFFQNKPVCERHFKVD